MKVLWFSLSPCGSVRRKKSDGVYHGWMISLEDEIKKQSNLQLGVSYLSTSENEFFKYENVEYYPIYNPRPQNIWNKIKDKLTIHKQDAIIEEMVAVVNSFQPDIIHIHGSESVFGHVADRVNNIPVVFSLQGILNPYSDKFFSGIDKTTIYRHESFITKIKQHDAKSVYNTFLQRANDEAHFLTKAKYVIGRTRFDKNISILFNTEVRYFVVNEILRKDFYGKEWNKTAYSKKVKLVSTISGGYYKGYETLLKAANNLKKYGQKDFEWIIAGLKENDNLVEMTEKILGFKSSDVNVKLLGLVDSKCLSEILLDADIYCQVSHIENSPNSLCEAMLVGTPCIASFAGGTNSILKDGVEGILVQDGDSFSLAGAITYLINNFDQALKFSKAAHQTAIVRHDIVNIVSSLINVYTQILRNE